MQMQSRSTPIRSAIRTSASIRFAGFGPGVPTCAWMSPIPSRRRSSPSQADAAGSEGDEDAFAARAFVDSAATEAEAAEAKAGVVRKDGRFMRFEITQWKLHRQHRILRAVILDAECNLDQHPPSCGDFEPRDEPAIVERVTVIVGKQPHAGHAMHFVTAPEIFLPVGKRRLDGTERAKQSAGFARTLPRAGRSRH